MPSLEDTIAIRSEFKVALSDIQVVKQLSFIENKYLEPKWPDVMTLEYTTYDIFDRLKIVREVNRKHPQRRAFIDLLKFFKD